MIRLLVVAWALLLAACSEREMSIALTVEGDLTPGRDFDEIRVATWRQGAQLWSDRYDLTETDGVAGNWGFRLVRTLD